MPEYKVNDDAVKQAKKLIDQGAYDDKTEWSEAAPSADDANKVIDREGFEEFARGLAEFMRAAGVIVG